MSFIATIDISTFIWSKEEYDSNPEHYYSLLSITPKLFENITKYRLPILMRTELCHLISSHFPYPCLSKMGYSDFSTKILRLLTTTNWITYNNQVESDIASIPDIIKDHFSINLKEEYKHQVLYLYDRVSEHKFITYYYFFNKNNNLILKKQDETVEVETLRYSNEEEIMAFFEKYKIKFRHNPKHDRYKSGGKVSPLSCYNERTNDTTKAQELLEKALNLGDDYYYYDEENNVYVQFVSSNDGTYHGFDVSDEKNNVPSQIKDKFNKNGRTF